MTHRRDANRRARKQESSPMWEPSAWLRGQIAEALAVAKPHLRNYTDVIIPLWHGHRLTAEEEFTCDRCRQVVARIGSGVVTQDGVHIGFGFCRRCADIEGLHDLAWMAA